MKFVKPIVVGIWRNAPFNPAREWERTLVMALEHGMWGVNHQPAAVFPGCIVAFDEPIDAEFFVSQSRGAAPIAVDPTMGQLFGIADDETARFFVRQGLAEFSNEAEFSSYVASLEPQKEEAMLTTKPKQNAVAVETKDVRTRSATKPVRIETKAPKAVKKGK
jgi:hypothetical protein